MSHITLTILIANSLLCLELSAKDVEAARSLKAQRVQTAPKIDGYLNDEVWRGAAIAANFIQSDPVEKARPSQRTEVRILYDDEAIYVGAMMYDTSPDSILKEFGNRDDDLNADAFRISLDTYYKQQDAFNFEITASGVQTDYKFSDWGYNAVWSSAVKILPNGWSAELKIPYSAFRFPAVDKQNWGVQFTRSIKRNREYNQWHHTPKGGNNDLNHWGKLVGIEQIETPLRLSVTPYLSTYTEHNQGATTGNKWSSSFSGGLDLKYGINESFTLDLTLLPDFSQVRSDNLVRNLSAFEITFAEQRPFFQEGVELYRRGGHFYSRRIGGTPLNFYGVEDELTADETLTANPNQATLLNATKISGRTKGGTGLGFLNAITDNTYATAKDGKGQSRRILTDPLTNYNVLVVDQQFKGNTSAFLINTSVIRDGTYDDANVTGGGFRTFVFDQILFIELEGAVSNKIEVERGVNVLGQSHEITLGKSKGQFKVFLSREVTNKDYDQNDFGITRETNFAENGLFFNYNFYNPFWKLLHMYNNFGINYDEKYSTGEMSSIRINVNSFFTFKNYLSMYTGANFFPISRNDFFEARTDGRKFVRPPGAISWFGISSDYKRTLALDLDFNFWDFANLNPVEEHKYGYSFRLGPRIRFSDRFSVENSVRYKMNRNEDGFVGSVGDTIYFGIRDVQTVTSLIEGRYLFRNNLSLSLRVRHYWSSEDYFNYFTLDNEGYLLHEPNYTTNEDANTNFFNLDLVGQWEFAPGSTVSLVWKNAISDQLSGEVIPNYFQNLDRTFYAEQLNSFSLRVLYYFDYLYLTKRKS